MSKSKRKKTTINSDAVARDVKKLAKEMAQNSAPGDFGTRMAPGAVRRESPLEQEMGSRKYREMIHDHNNANKNSLDKLPFTFPKKSIVRSHRSNVLVECIKCGYEKYASEHTYGIVCPNCKKYRRVINPEAIKRGRLTSKD